MKLLKNIKCWLYVVYLSFKWMFRINSGDVVIYKPDGKKYRVLYCLRHSERESFCLENNNIGWVPRNECKKKNMIGSFISGYQFYMGYWFGIWVRNGEWYE